MKHRRVAEIAIALVCGTACGATMKAKEADVGYFAQQLKCVDENPTKVEIDACRAEVKRRWEAARDGGAE